jgi:hypothetical protein
MDAKSKVNSPQRERQRVSLRINRTEVFERMCRNPCRSGKAGGAGRYGRQAFVNGKPPALTGCYIAMAWRYLPITVRSELRNGSGGTPWRRRD